MLTNLNINPMLEFIKFLAYTLIFIYVLYNLIYFGIIGFKNIGTLFFLYKKRKEITVVGRNENGFVMSYLICKKRVLLLKYRLTNQKLTITNNDRKISKILSFKNTVTIFDIMFTKIKNRIITKDNNFIVCDLQEITNYEIEKIISDLEKTRKRKNIVSLI